MYKVHDLNPSWIPEKDPYLACTTDLLEVKRQYIFFQYV